MFTNKENVTIRLPKELIEKLDEIAERQLSTRTQVIRTTLAKEFMQPEVVDGPATNS